MSYGVTYMTPKDENVLDNDTQLEVIKHNESRQGVMGNVVPDMIKET
jgi:hypothetical protein